MWLRGERALPYYKSLVEKVVADPNRVGPSFEILYTLRLETIKCVVIGQDPYSNGYTEAGVYTSYYDGLAFSAANSARTPASLKILKQWFINTDLISGFEVGNVPNDLRYLVQRGVFLGNTAWSVSRGRPLSHMWDEWYIFTGRLVQYISTKRSVPFLLLGSRAHSLANFIHGQCPVYLERHPAAEKYNKESKSLVDSTALHEITRQTGIKWTL